MSRILTTHVGSLPRPDDLIRTMFAKPVAPNTLQTCLPRRDDAVAPWIARSRSLGGLGG